jgi:hypothetical protein
MIPVAVQLGETPVLIVRGIAALAGAFAGAFLAGLIARLVVRLARPKPMPGWALALVRLGGAAGGALLVWFLLANLGFGTGWGTGSGSGSDKGKDKGTGKTEENKDEKTVRRDQVEPKDRDKSSQNEKPLHVYVLGLKDLQQRLKVESPNIDHCYWIQGDPPADVRDFDGLQRELRNRRDKNPKLKVYMDETPNSPDRSNRDFCVPLERWLRRENLYTEER